MTGVEPRRVDGAHGRGVGAAVALLAVAAVLGSCTWMPDTLNPMEWYRSTGDAAKGQPATSAVRPMPGADKPFPKLSTVPPRPTEEERQLAAARRGRVASSLAADREQARYSDQVIRHQGDGEATPPQSAARATAPSVPPQVTPLALPAPRISLPSPPAASAPPPAPRLAQSGTGSSQAGSSALTGLTFGAPPADIAAQQGGFYTLKPGSLTPGSLTPGSLTPGPAQNFGLDVGGTTTVYFAAGSARVGARGRRLIRRAFKAHSAQGGTLRVVGHASSRTRDLDLVSHQMANFNVSLDRANAVARELIRLGAKPDAVIVDAASDSRPVALEVMPSGEAKNRRAEIFLER